jgi:hypothetical protein
VHHAVAVQEHHRARDVERGREYACHVAAAAGAGKGTARQRVGEGAAVAELEQQADLRFGQEGGEEQGSAEEERGDPAPARASGGVCRSCGVQHALRPPERGCPS